MMEFEVKIVDVLNTNEGVTFIMKTKDGIIIKPKLMNFKGKFFINLVTKERRALNVAEIINQVTKILNCIKKDDVKELVFNYPCITKESLDAERLLKTAFKTLNISFANEKEHVYFFDCHDH